MRPWAFWRDANHHFFNHWGSYVTLVFLTNLVVSYIAVPVFTWLTSALMRWQNVPYVSYTNIGSLVIKHPLAILGLVVILLPL